MPRTEAGTMTATIEPRRVSRGLQEAFIDERNDVLAVINELEDQLDRHQEIRETMERELTGTSEKLQVSDQRVQELEWQVVTLQTRVDALEQLRQDVASLEEELSDANGCAQRINDQLTETDKERNRLRAELKAANKQVDELWPVRKERDGLKSDCKVLSNKVDVLERAQRETLEERARLQTELRQTQIILEEITTERNQLQMSVRDTQDSIQEFKRLNEALEDKIETLRAEKKTFQAQITHLERENARLVEQRQFYECEITSLRNRSRTSESALTSVKKAFTEVRVALTETKSRARRRSLNTWPHAGTTLRGIERITAEKTMSVARGEQALATGTTGVIPAATNLEPIDDTKVTQE